MRIKFKWQTMVTPDSYECRWPYIQTPDTEYKEEGDYKIDIPADQALVDAMAEFYDSAMKEFLAAAKADPTAKPSELKRLESLSFDEVIKSYEKDDKVFEYIRFKSKFKPAVYDSEGNSAPNMKVFGGDTVKLQFSINPWVSAMGSGMGLRLKAVQVVKRGEYASGGANPFSNEGSGAVADESSQGEGSDSSRGTGEKPPFVAED